MFAPTVIIISWFLGFVNGSPILCNPYSTSGGQQYYITTDQDTHLDKCNLISKCSGGLHILHRVKSWKGVAARINRERRERDYSV